MVGVALVFISNFLPFNAAVAGITKGIGIAIALPIGVIGAALGVAMLVKPTLFNCPICLKPAAFCVSDKSPALVCTECGLVSCKNVLFSFAIEVDPDDSTSS